MDLLSQFFFAFFAVIGGAIVTLGFMFNAKMNQLCVNQMIVRAILSTFDPKLTERMWPNPKTFSRFNYAKLMEKVKKILSGDGK